MHDQTENVGLEMMKHHTLFNTFNPVRLISQAVRKRHVVEVRRDVGEEADGSYHVEQERLFD
ncbi:hypothetical protein D3C73_1459970 [compost metagenome]